MIARLKGILLETTTDTAVIDVHGIGYLVFASRRTLEKLGAVGNETHVYVETHVREDALQLFAFFQEDERKWFRLLQTVQGVGNRVALALLSTLSLEELGDAIANGDKKVIARTAGIGPKLAVRIVNELADKTPSLHSEGENAALVTRSGDTSSASLREDALSALENLGFRPAEAYRLVQLAQEELGNKTDTAALVRLALKKSNEKQRI